MQRVEGVEELLLRLLLALQELDVVDEEHVDIAIAALEIGGLVVADAVDEVVGELLGVHVAHFEVGVEVAAVVTDGVEQVGLAQSGVAIDEERVVRPGGGLAHRGGRGVREAVAVADDEGLEGVLRIEAGQLDLLGDATASVGQWESGHRSDALVILDAVEFTPTEGTPDLRVALVRDVSH